MHHRRNIISTLAAVALATALSACGDKDDPQTKPTPSATVSQSPSPTASAWTEKYSPAQVAAYDAALKRWNEYESRSEPIWAQGKATNAAANLFKQYFPSPMWQGQYKQLASYQDADVKVSGTPGVFWEKPKSISANALSVELEQCVDYTKGTTTQAGKQVSAPDWVSNPNLRTIQLSKPEGYDWLIYKITDASSGKARPCEP